MASIAGMSARHNVVWYNPNIACRIDGIRTDKELIALLVNHTIGWGTTYTLLASYQPVIWCYLIQFIRRTFRRMRSISNKPQAICPRDYGSRTTFTFKIIVGQSWINTRDVIDEHLLQIISYSGNQITPERTCVLIRNYLAAIHAIGHFQTTAENVSFKLLTPRGHFHIRARQCPGFHTIIGKRDRIVHQLTLVIRYYQIGQAELPCFHLLIL